MSAELEIVKTFHEEFNTGRRDEVMAMAADDISIGGGRGQGDGAALLREWVGRATTTMAPLRWFQKDDIVVVEERIEWRAGRDDRVTDSTVWGLAFTLAEGKIVAIARYANIGEAVTSSGLDESNEVVDVSRKNPA